MGGFRWGLGRFFGLFGPSSRAVYGATLVFFGNLSADESKFNFLILLWPVRSGILVCSQFYLTVISCLMCCGLWARARPSVFIKEISNDYSPFTEQMEWHKASSQSFSFSSSGGKNDIHG